MRRQTGRVAAAILFTVLASPSFGQIVGMQSSSPRLGVTGPGCTENNQAGAPMRTQPYTAELKTTTVQVLANGATITRESTEVRAVDSQQRTFTSRTEARGSSDQPSFTWANVNDPVENIQANWDSQTKTARVIKLPLEAERHGCWATDSGNMRMSYGPASPEERASARQRIKAMIPVSVNRASEPKMEDLGTMTIEGVEVHGNRMTNIIPVGQVGNDKELVTTSENWFATSLGLLMRQVNDSPQSGKTTMEVTHLDLSEPPLTTFQPPEGYEVSVEELHQVPCQETHMSAGVTGAVHGTVH